MNDLRLAFRVDFDGKSLTVASTIPKLELQQSVLAPKQMVRIALEEMVDAIVERVPG